MQTIIQWVLAHMNPSVLVAAGLSFLLGLEIIKAKLGKAVIVIGDLADLLSEIKASLADGKVDVNELNEIVKDGEQLLADWKK